MKKCFTSCLVGLLVIFCNNVYADVFTGEWRLFVESDGTEIADNAPSVRLKVSKVGDFYNVLVILPEANRKSESMRQAFTGKYVLSDDEKTIEHLSGGASFKYRKAGNMICSGKDILKGVLSDNLGCFRHVKADANPATQREPDTLQNNQAALNFREMETKEGEGYIWKSFGVFTGVQYDKAWSALIAELGKLPGMKIRVQDKTLGMIEVFKIDQDDIVFNFKFTRMKSKPGTRRSQIRLDIVFAHRAEADKTRVISTFAKWMDIVQNGSPQATKDISTNKKIILSDETLNDKQKRDATFGGLSSIRSALQVYYGDNSGKFPKNLDELTQGAKYLSEIPYEYMTFSNKVTNIDIDVNGVKDFGNYITNEGGWLYFRNGDVCVNISAKDSRGNELYKY